LFLGKTNGDCTISPEIGSYVKNRKLVLGSARSTSPDSTLCFEPNIPLLSKAYSVGMTSSIIYVPTFALG
jgi:hypothetical protein